MSHVRQKHEILDPHGNVHTLVYTTHEQAGEEGDPHKAFDDACCRAFGRLLHGEYRGHAWNVWVSAEQGIAKIWLSDLMDPTVPYVLHLHRDLLPIDVIRAGGELLERFNIPRSAVDFSMVADIRRKMGPLLGRIVAPGGHIKGQ